MLRLRNVLSAVLLVAFSCSALAQSPQYPHPKVKNSKLSANNSAGQPGPTIFFPTAQEIEQAVTNGIERADEKLDANHPTVPPDNSVWNFNLFLVVFNGLLVVVGGVNCLLIFWTLKATTTSANAAEKSARVAEQALIAGQRAFISVSFRVSANKNTYDGKIYSYSFTPVWFNAGNTPTRNMENHVNIHRFEKEIAEDWDFPNLWNAKVPADKRLPIPLGVSPKNTVDGQTLGVDIKTIQDVIDGKKVLYFWGSAAYNDVFPDTERHVTRFAVQIVAGGKPEEPEHMSWSFPFLPKYNCSDEECKYQGVPAGWKPRQMDVE